MAELIGLRMQGIRSISDHPHIIQFLHPLTIIQGPNGTGKTTIIEALNYVTTGALPAGKMHSFIHNNKLANRSRVDALVQLKFRDLKGNVCTATKRMFANTTAKGGKPTTKSDEFTLMITDKFGNEKSLSSKVADFNKEMLNLLGVPKAILEHVVFCHQEESNWPLSEPKELKIRFDAIFEVTKYVKALDNIKKNIKELEIQLRLIDSELPHLNANREARANLNLSYEENQKILENNKSIIEKYKVEKLKIDERIAELSKDVEMASKSKHRNDLLISQLNAKRQFFRSIRADDFLGERNELAASLNQLRKENANSIALAEERKVFLRTTEDNIRRADQQFRNTSGLLTKAENTMNQMSNTITLKQKDLDKYNAAIREVISDPSLIDQRLDDIRVRLQKERAELGLADGSGFLYGKWEAESIETHACPLCERRFLKTADVAAFGGKMRKNRDDLPEKIRTLKTSLCIAEEEERRLANVKPILKLALTIERDELPKAKLSHQMACDEICNLTKKRDADEAELNQLRDNFKSVSDSQIDAHKQDNQLRVMEEQLRKLDLKKEIDELEAQMTDNEWKGRDHEELLKENAELSQKAALLNNKIQQKLGEQSQVESKIREILRELKNKRYADAKHNYLKKIIERAVMTSAIQDLSKFWKVLDDSIINFHQQKMEQINQILQELWMRVYRGNDIETIKIKSQPVSGSEKKKSYDYSVMMTVDQMEIDMRDHCSAGQKMLASILIRIALADVFAGNCPILALDEPTTNLDSDKVENIGAMLKSLLEYRNASSFSASYRDHDDDDLSQQTYQLSMRPSATAALKYSSQRTLQLLVITHDSRLVEHLYLACRPEYIYALRKDENGNSRCTQHNRVYAETGAEDFD